jgi:hypothetical protein
MSSRISRIEALDIRQDNQRICIDKRRDHRRKIVIIANLDLIDGHGIILIDDRNRPDSQLRQQ